MIWIFLFIVLHLFFGVFCAYLAHENRHRTESWFLAGTLLGGLALLGFWFMAYRKHIFSA